MDIFAQLVEKIIINQQTVIGPLAWSEAGKVKGITITDHKVTVSENGKGVLEALVKQYEKLFGQASVELCKDAIRPLLSKTKNVDLPSILL